MISAQSVNDAALPATKQKLEFIGLSTDTKPTTWGGKAVANGSFWQNIDNGALYCFDEENQTWCEW